MEAQGREMSSLNLAKVRAELLFINSQPKKDEILYGSSPFSGLKKYSTLLFTHTVMRYRAEKSAEVFSSIENKLELKTGRH